MNNENKQAPKNVNIAKGNLYERYLDRKGKEKLRLKSGLIIEYKDGKQYKVQEDGSYKRLR